MGSVKDLVVDNSAGGKLYRLPTFNSLGLGAWKVSGRFSVGDLKEKIPPQEIKDKNFVLAMTAGYYWEQAANAGFQSSYVGMLDATGQIVSVETLLNRGEKSDIVVMKLAITPHDLSHKITVEARDTYHRLIESGLINAYIADAECIFRFGFPLGSSTFKKIFGAAGMADRYELLATYDETVRGLQEVRAISGIMEKPKMQKVLADAGLDSIPDPGYLMDRPVINFDTKFNPAGDKTISDDEVRHSMYLDDLSFASWKATLVRNAYHQREFCKEVGIVNMDGKTEAMVVHGVPIFTDFACTVDENRPMLRYEAGSRSYLIPASKEIQRAVFRQLGIYAAKETAQRDHGDDWLEYIGQYVTDKQIEDATAESIWMMEQAIATVGNQLLRHDIFEAKPIEEWVGPFLPYASILQ